MCSIVLVKAGSHGRIPRQYRITDSGYQYVKMEHPTRITPALIATKERICLDFNMGTCTIGGLSKNHTDGAVRHMHYCMYCMATDNIKIDNHGAAWCQKKHRHASLVAASTHTTQQAPPQFPPPYQHPKHLALRQNGPIYQQYTQPVATNTAQQPATAQSFPKNR